MRNTYSLFGNPEEKLGHRVIEGGIIVKVGHEDTGVRMSIRLKGEGGDRVHSNEPWYSVKVIVFWGPV
jgi:hypothetical protein